MENSRQFLKRLAGFSIGPIGAALLGFINVPIQTWLVDPAQLGKASMYTMAFSLTSLFLNLGIDQAYVREYNAEKDKKNLLWNTFLIPFIFSIIIMFVYLYFYEPISVLLFDSVEKYIIQILAFVLPFAIIFRFNTLIIRMKEKARLYSFVQIFHRLMTLGFTVIILLFFNRNFKGIIQAQFFSMVSIAIITTVINLKDWIYKFKIDKKLIKKVTLFGLPLIPTSIMMWVLNSMDKIALRTWADFEAIGLYSAAFKIVSVVVIIQQAFATFWAPTVYRWYESDTPLRKYEMVSNKLNSLLTLLFAFIVLFKDQIILILSPEYKNAAIIVPFLMFYPIMYTLATTTSMGINFVRKTYYNILVTAIASGLNILGNILLVPQLGALGASISTGISYIVYFLIATIFSRMLWEKMDIKRHFVSIFLMVVMASLSVVYNNFYIDLVMFGIIFVYHFKEFLWGMKLFKQLIIEIKNKRSK
ncbi:lipopolysaccharide biosynthesis protein [Geotoga petraea]|uniref:Membrane protein involved in the export of O-antigen and teichoic acid n=1 Tax=Geotoga petraea TaxID=28234 RepID=A0A1G6QA00_9BACT|nr:oligosaccharide flippase family protein [Geotoga petraea]SDC89332.1 Membrane protein involved in the export of O-antigen and teichoic acid [Geotoga petraea]